MKPKEITPGMKVWGFSRINLEEALSEQPNTENLITDIDEYVVELDDNVNDERMFYNIKVLVKRYPKTYVRMSVYTRDAEIDALHGVIINSGNMVYWNFYDTREKAEEARADALSKYIDMARKYHEYISNVLNNLK